MYTSPKHSALCATHTHLHQHNTCPQGPHLRLIPLLLQAIVFWCTIPHTRVCPMVVQTRDCLVRLPLSRATSAQQNSFEPHPYSISITSSAPPRSTPLSMYDSLSILPLINNLDSFQFEVIKKSTALSGFGKKNPSEVHAFWFLLGKHLRELLGHRLMCIWLSKISQAIFQKQLQHSRCHHPWREFQWLLALTSIWWCWLFSFLKIYFYYFKLCISGLCLSMHM